MERARRGAAGRGDSADSGSGEWAIVPILRGDVCTAVRVLAHSDRIPYTNDEITALEEVARLLAVSIERVDLFAQTEHSARHDLLTGLPNYRYLQERLREVQAGVSAPSSTSLLMVDMDDLKLFNDTLGHGAGDDAIQAVGRALRAVCRTEDFVTHRAPRHPERAGGGTRLRGSRLAAAGWRNHRGPAPGGGHGDVRGEVRGWRSHRSGIGIAGDTPQARLHWPT